MKKIVIKIILTPFIFTGACFSVFALMFFPLGLLIFFSMVSVLASPFIFLMRNIGYDIDYMEPIEEITGNDVVDSLIWSFCPIWIPFYAVYSFLIDKNKNN